MLHSNVVLNHKEQDTKTTGLFKPLCKVTLPLMLATLSGTLMLFVDRLVLARYGTTAMNAATTTGMTFAVFQFGTVSIAAIAEVFVGQFNGAKQYAKIGPSVWQMIWFSLASIVIFLGAYAFAPALIPDELETMGLPYFQTLTLLGPGFPLFAALSAFYIGRGEAGFVTFAVIISGFLNLVLDLILVFGVGPFPELGTMGAAIATGVAQWVGAVILLMLFLSKKNRQRFHTHQYQFNWKMFWHSVKIGIPHAGGHIFVIASWSFLLAMLSKISVEHMTVFAVGQSIWILVSFITEGGSKGATALTANLIGAKQFKQIHHVLKAGILLQLCFMMIAIIPLMLFPHVLIEWFLPHASNAELKSMAIEGCRWLFFALAFDGFMWVVIGILVAGGDTRFVMIMSTLTAWIFGVFPGYLLINLMGGGPSLTLFCMLIFTFCTFICFYLRYQRGNWLKLQASET